MPKQIFTTCFFLLVSLAPVSAQVLDKQQLLENQSWWDNRDFEWYKEQIPFFECPDSDIQTTYYYRWDLLTKHLTYGSPNSGYSFTEFIDRPFWSGCVWRDRLSRGSSTLRGTLASFTANCERLHEILVPNTGCSTPQLLDLDRRFGLGGRSSSPGQGVADRLAPRPG